MNWISKEYWIIKERSLHHPSAVGWYAIQYFWDDNEGIFIAAAHWDGHNWREGYSWEESWEIRRLPISAWSSEPFDKSEDAWAWAKAHDPEAA